MSVTTMDSVEFLRERAAVSGAWSKPFAVKFRRVADEYESLTAKLAEAERERDSTKFDKARMLDERQIFLKGMDELRAEVARAIPEPDARQRFELWLNSKFLALDGGLNEWTGEFEYAYPHIQSMWVAWQGAIEALRPELEDAERRLDESAARLRELREAVEAAPHHDQCACWHGPCNCWKAAALAKSGEPK